MKKALVIQHVREEDSGTLGKALLSSGFSVDTLYIFKGQKVVTNPSAYDLVVIMGGPMGVYEADSYPFINQELKLIENAFKLNIPVIGICLGSQLMATVLGSRVYNSGEFEAGWFDVEIISDNLSSSVNLKNLPQKFKAFHLHGDTFEIPQGAVHLARSKKFNSQMFRYNNSYALQFHIEVTDKLVRDMIAENYNFLVGKIGKDNSDNIIIDSAKYCNELQKHSKNLFTSIIRHL